LDIEYDSSNKSFVLVAYYTQKPSFPSLFQRLVGSSALEKVEAEIFNKDSKPRIYKTDWKPKSDLDLQIGARNVIYMLADQKKQLLYIGEATDLIKRLSQKYRAIPDWDYFRYDVLPDELIEFRVTLERMLIRSFATVLPNRKGIKSLEPGSYSLANEKIDS